MREIAAIAGIAAGVALLFPAVASAGTAEQSLSVKVSGTSVTLHGTCVGENVHAEGNYGVRNGHEPIEAGVMKADGHRQVITFEHIKPGKYIAFMSCADQPSGESTIVDFTISSGKPTSTPTAKPKPETTTAAPAAPQVVKTPAGAPQTGGGPADDGSGPGVLAVGGSAAGLAAAAGAGFWFVRRRRA
ncbi:hypothetical protein ACIOD2_08675 [Amycolatopsis sp. NPDC088138]|uniref:hypothetical protein n=1 Tax=Amycolatopsis sp. NPDC088138 TaxID=3363938 RepID=UPI003822EB9E